MYYTKRCIRKIVGLIRNEPETELPREKAFRGEASSGSQSHTAYSQWYVTLSEPTSQLSKPLNSRIF